MTPIRVLILYGSLTGNTLLVSEYVKTFLETEGYVVDSMDQSLCEFEKLNEYNLTIIGASTWGEGEANPSTQLFIEALDSYKHVEFQHVALFGLGDMAYDHFCGVVDKLEKSLSLKNIKPLAPSLRLDGFPDEKMFQCVERWLRGDILPQL